MTKPLLPPQLTRAATMRPGSNVGPSSAGGRCDEHALGRQDRRAALAARALSWKSSLPDTV
eukprot:9036443-Pyramimonas_sp.AAC.1